MVWSAPARPNEYDLVYTVDEQMQAFYKVTDANIPTFNGDDSWELPAPAAFVIAQDGTIQFNHADADFTRRLEPSEILNALRVLK